MKHLITPPPHLFTKFYSKLGALCVLMLLIISVFSSCQKESSKIDTHNKSKDESGDVLVSNRSEHCEACPELIANPDLTVDVALCNPPYNGARSFQDGAVNDWIPTYRTPHHTTLSNGDCRRNPLSTNNSENFNCIQATTNNNNNEGMHTLINIVNDPHYTYCVSMNIVNLVCPFVPENFTSDVAIRFAHNIPTNSSSPDNPDFGSYPFYRLGEVQLNNYTSEIFSVVVNPSTDFPSGQSYSGLQMFSYGAENFGANVSFSNVSVRCSTDDLIDINVVDNGGCELTFSPLFDTKTVEEYLSMTWDFGDGSSPVTTTNPSITYQYATNGIYKVSLTVVDVNQCCGVFSKDINCGDNTCDFYLCWSTNWPDPGCTYTNCSNEHSMQWFDDVTGIEVLKNGVYTFHPFNSSIHVNGGYAQIWGQIKEILNQEYSIPYSAFYETDPDNEVTCWKGESMTLFNFFIDDVPTVGQSSIQGIKINGSSGQGLNTQNLTLDFYQKDCK